MDCDNRMSAPASSTLFRIFQAASPDQWAVYHMKRLVDRTTTWIWCQLLIVASYPVETIANVENFFPGCLMLESGYLV